MKIFIAEYIMFYETFDLSLYEELNISSLAFDYMNYYDSLCNLNNRFTFKLYHYPYPSGTSIYLRKKQYAHDFFWKRRFVRYDLFRYIWPLWFLPKKWMKLYSRWREITMSYKFFQYSYLNELIGNFYVDHEQIRLFKSEYPKYDCALIYNHSNKQFNRKLIWLFENRRNWRWKGFVFFRPRPVYFEFLLWNIRFYKGVVNFITLNPRCYYLTSGNVITYAKKWIYWTYHVYNIDRSRPFVVYGFWTENFFTETFKYRVISYRFEFFRDSIYLLEFLVGSSEIIKMYIYFFYKTYLYYVVLFWISIIFSLFYSREKLLKLILLDEHLGNFTWLYSVFFNNIVSIQSIVRQRNMIILKKEGRKLERKSQLESKIFKKFKNLFYIPLIVVYLENFVNSKIYRNWVDKCVLGSLKDFDTNDNYAFLLLIFINIPFRFFSTFKTAYYKVHMFYYFKLNHRFKHSKLYNARSTYSFNRYFFTDTVHIRELDHYSAFDILERIVNFINIHSKKEYKDLMTELITQTYQTKLYSRTKKRKEEYFEYFYYRTFGNYDPELEFYQVKRSRFFTSWWWYSTDFSFNLLTTHQLYMFFSYIHSPLHVRFNSSSIYNFYFILFYTPIFYYHYYYVYFFSYKLLPKDLINGSVFTFYLCYFVSMLLYINDLIIYSFTFMFDGKSFVFLRYFWRVYINVIFLWLKNKYFFVKYIYFIVLFIYFFLCYLFELVFNYIKLFIIFIFNRLFNFFSSLNNDFGISYSSWHRYYLIKFYLTEYNVFYHIFIFIRNFFFNFLLIFLCFFVLTTIPYVKELIFSDYLIYYFYSFLNKIFEYNKFIYFNEVLDNWWVPYFSPKKFINFYNGYCNYFEFRLRKLIGKYIVYTAHLGKRKFGFNKFFFDMYFKRHLYYLQFNKFHAVYIIFRNLIPNSFPWELYFYLHGYFLLVGHPARHFLPQIYWHTLPIYLTYILRYKYFMIVSKIFIPIYWFWKYSFSFLVFYSFMYFENTIFFNFVFNFFKIWYNFYANFNYYFFYFCYYYFFYFFFTISKLMRYYFVTYDFLNFFWIYRSARFIIILDIFNFFRMCIDSIYFFFIESFYGFFYYFYKIVYFILNFFGLISFLNYLSFSINFIPKINVFFSELFDKFYTINYDLDEYAKILSKHFRHKTRYRIGDWTKRDIFVRSIYKMVHRTISFEFKFRQFLFYNKKGLLKNFLIFNKIKLNTFNLFFFSCASLYLNYILLIFFFSFFSLNMHRTYKNDSIISPTPFFEWERFTKKNRHLLGRDEFYWLYNIRWLNRFEFYVDKCFSDDLYLHVFRSNEVRFGYYLYKQWSKFFIYNEPFLYATLNNNRFLLYKRYYLERYISIIKDIDFIFHEYSISKKKVQNKIFSFYDLFIPKIDKNMDFDFQSDLVKLSQSDLYWFYFATPQLLYTRNWNFIRVMSREELSKEFYFKLKKSLFKAYSFYEMNRDTMHYDLFEFQFFEPDFYEEILYDHISVHNASEKNYFLHRIALSRWNTELIYVTPTKDFSNLYAHVGYHDFVDRLEYRFEYLRNLNSRYFGNLIDFTLFGFVQPVHTIVTHIDAEIVKSSIDLSLSDDAIGIKYSELYQFEDLGRVATEEYLFTFLDSAFDRSKDDPTINIVALSDDTSLAHRHINTWWILLFFLPAVSTVTILMEYIFSYQYILPHLWVRDLLSIIFYRILRPEDAEIIVFHKLLTWERIEHFYWLNPWIWTKKHVFDLFWIDHLSFWTGKHAHFVQSKEEYIWVQVVILLDIFRYDTLTFLWWTFYIDAWNECPIAVIIFVLADFFFYLLCLLFFLFIFNFALRFIDFYHYVSKKVHIVLDKNYDIEAYRAYEEEKRQKREKKKEAQFDFFSIAAFSRYKNKVKSYIKEKTY